MKCAIVDGQKVKVGDYVCFKSDYEQSGKIVDIKHNMFGSVQLVLTNPNGFGGDYLCGSDTTVELASDCWVE
jgi:hypothetical protein